MSTLENNTDMLDEYDFSRAIRNPFADRYWRRPAMNDYRELLALSDANLKSVDPALMNLLVAKSIPALANLDFRRYIDFLDQVAEAVRERLPAAEQAFSQTPSDWKNDINFFRLGVLCGFLEREVGIAYKEEQRYLSEIQYTNPSDLFVNGVIDTRRGTCGNMATLHLAIGWRLGWPVSLACAKSHYVLRYDDGKVVHNIEATQSGYGGFRSPPDDQLMVEHKLPVVAIECGSDLRALSPRELLGVFIGLRARHVRDCGRNQEAELDYLLARSLYPTSRRLFIDCMALILRRSTVLFD